MIPEVVVETNPPVQLRMSAPPEVSYNARPLTLEEQRWLGKGFCYSIGGIALGKGADEKIYIRLVFTYTFFFLLMTLLSKVSLNF